jgi:formate hydrogenlyase subunit 3/multisubunit Na+/H+ antiporter MnhD subunit
MAGTGIVALVSCRWRRPAAVIAVIGACAGGVVGLWGAILALLGGLAAELTTTWRVPGGAFVVGIDPLSAFFLAPLFALGALCAVYGRSYLGARPVAAAMLNVLLAAMAIVLVARHALLFLVAWEVMTLLAYLLVTFEHREGEVRRAGWVYLIASHVAIVALLALFLGLGTRSSGALDFAALADSWRAPAAGTAGVLLLALVGFGIKAGVVGLHVWLPEAHAAAPSHVSALMSGVLIKLGVYGLLRVALLVVPGPWFGPTLAILGAAGAVVGIALALYQHDLKRILAYSSVENIGVILLGVGLGFWARGRGDARLAALAFGGALLHVWNHAAMKGLLFLGAGSVLHGAGTKDVERLGGLMRLMPWTGRAMFVGAVAIAALPPLNGFAGEWLLYRALAEIGLHGAPAPSLAAVGGIAALALVGGLAALCFVRLVGVVLLGTPRGDGAARAHESPPAMTVPLGILAAACVAGALAAPALVSTQATVLEQLGTVDVAGAAAYLAPLAVASFALLGAILALAALLARRVRRAEPVETWGCGYAAPTARMQYTGRGFAELASARLLPRWLRARARTRAPEGPFPASASFATDAVDPLTRAGYEPLLVRLGSAFSRLRFLQQGNVHVYIVYIVATAILALAWVAARDWMAP